MRAGAWTGLRALGIVASAMSVAALLLVAVARPVPDSIELQVCAYFCRMPEEAGKSTPLTKGMGNGRQVQEEAPAGTYKQWLERKGRTMLAAGDQPGSGK